MTEATPPAAPAAGNTEANAVVIPADTAPRTSDAKPDDTPKAAQPAVQPAGAPAAATPPANTGDSPAPKPAEAPAATADTQDDYGSYGHPAADAAVTLLRNRGISAEESSKWFEEAANTGDASKIDTKAILAKLGNADGSLVIAAVRDYLTEHNTTVAETVKNIYAIAGGEQNFGLIRDWALKRESADPVFAKTLEACRAMLANGPESAAIAARELVRLYNSDGSNKSLHVNLMTGDSAGLSVSYISKADYFKQYSAAHEKNDHREMSRLDQLRKLSIAQDKSKTKRN